MNKNEQAQERLRLRELREKRLAEQGAQSFNDNKEIKEILLRIEQLLIKVLKQKNN